MKKMLLRTPLAKPLKVGEGYIQNLRLSSAPADGIQGNRTVYCVSPYKTGTTFLSSGFDSKIAAHEPLQYLTIKKLEQGFDPFFIKRLNYLNLKLECSGFLSAYINELTNHELTKDLSYICVLREPGKWISSLLNYWTKLVYLNFDYINEFFWKKKVNVDLVDFERRSEGEKQDIIKKLVEFYLHFTAETFRLRNIRHIHISELDQYAEGELASQIGEKRISAKVFRRENKDKKIYQLPEADQKYRELLDSHGIEIN